jgi:hypothetical protein
LRDTHVHLSLALHFQCASVVLVRYPTGDFMIEGGHGVGGHPQDATLGMRVDLDGGDVGVNEVAGLLERGGTGVGSL